MRLVSCLLLVAGSACCSTLQTIQYVGQTTAFGFTDFMVDGQAVQLLCDNFDRSIPTSPYLSQVDSLFDLTGSILNTQNDPQALLHYQWIGIIALQAYLDPTLAPAATRALQHIINPNDPLTGGAAALLTFAQNADPSTFDLSGVRIYTSSQFQEQVGVIGPVLPFESSETPEPGSLSMLMLGMSLIAAAGFRPRRRAASINSSTN